MEQTLPSLLNVAELNTLGSFAFAIGSFFLIVMVCSFNEALKGIFKTFLKKEMDRKIAVAVSWACAVGASALAFWGHWTCAALYSAFLVGMIHVCYKAAIRYPEKVFNKMFKLEETGNGDKNNAEFN